MKVIGIVAEYNPFHNGHKYQIDYARNILKADYIVVAMSGSFTQRGTIACFDKYLRAKAALLNGADLVFEIPTVFATSSAREFASAGVQLLASTGVVNTLLFGAETDDIEGFKDNIKKIIEIENSDEYNAYINIEVSKGISFAESRANYLKKHIDTAFISSSNNILGAEYVKYIIENNLSIEPVCLKRQGNDYNDTIITGNMSSASAIRNSLADSADISEQIPTNCSSLYNEADHLGEDDISSLLHYKLLSEDDFSNYLDCSKDLSDRICKLRNEFISYTQFADLLKTKNISYTRVSRALCHILLGLKYEDFTEAKNASYIEKLRLLGFSKNGSCLLKDIKRNGTATLITSPDNEINKFDIISSDIYRITLTNKYHKAYPNEYTRKFDLTNI